MEPIKLRVNEFWGRRSGSIQKTRDGVLFIFKQRQYGSGRTGNAASFNTKLINIPRKWFGKTYKTKAEKNGQKHKRSGK
jgi:hypothetical protein